MYVMTFLLRKNLTFNLWRFRDYLVLIYLNWQIKIYNYKIVNMYVLWLVTEIFFPQKDSTPNSSRISWLRKNARLLIHLVYTRLTILKRLVG